jgi:hypothetical protein
MPHVYNHLSATLPEDDGGGLSPLDLTDLPDDQRQIMLGLLRDPASTNEGVTLDALSTRLEGKVEQLDDGVALLVRQGWLIGLGEPSRLRYRPNFRTKRSSLTGFNLWAVLSDRLPEDWKESLKPNAT